MEAVLRAEHVSKNFGILPVLQDISLELHAGEVVCLLGASGSGKSTFLRLLAGLDADYSGTIECAIARPGPRLGYLPQNEKLLPWRSALRNVALGLELLKKHRNAVKAKALEALSGVGLASYARHYPAQLSGGVQQRVLLARMLAVQPGLLLLDEPMSNLDVLARRELATLIKSYVKAQNAAALVVTHSVEEACFLADRILLVTRAPARVHKEICIGENDDRDQVLSRVMHELWQALETAA